MKQVSLDEVLHMANNARENLYEQATSRGYDAPRVYVHWTAGHYGQLYLNDYHIAIDADGSIWAEKELDVTLAHTWRRNTGGVGLTMACACGADTEDLGDEPPTPAQIEVMAQVIAKVAEGLWLTIDKKHILTHGEAADNEDGVHAHEPYGPKSTVERWDLEYLGTPESPSYNPWATDGSRGGDVLRGKANFYRNKWRQEANENDR